MEYGAIINSDAGTLSARGIDRESLARELKSSSNPKRPQLNTGRLWFCMTRVRGTWPLMKACWGFTTGRLEELPEVDTGLATSLKVRAHTGYMRVAVDGEACRMRTPLELRSLPSALEVVVP